MIALLIFIVVLLVLVGLARWSGDNGPAWNHRDSSGGGGGAGGSDS